MRLNQDRLVDAALALVDDLGEESLSMRTLAARVDRQVSSLYNHVSGRGELIELMRARIVAGIDVQVFAGIEESSESVSWDRGLELWARSYLRAFADHPNLIRLLATTSIRDLSTYEMYDSVIGGLRRGGWPQGQTVAVMRSVEAYVLGSALDIVAPVDLITQESAGDRFAEIRGALDPRFGENSSAVASFEFGLTSLIQGLKHQLDAVS